MRAIINRYRIDQLDGHHHRMVYARDTHDSKIWPVLLFEIDGDVIMINDISVKPNFRGRGIATQMVESLCNMYPDKTIKMDDRGSQFSRKLGYIPNFEPNIIEQQSEPSRRR